VDEAVPPHALRLARLIAAAGYATPDPVPSRTAPYTVREAAAIIGCCRATLYREIQRGRCRAYRIGEGRGTLRIKVEAFREYLRSLEANAATSAEPAAVTG
jgi:excisionase family DNA binding protein